VEALIKRARERKNIFCQHNIGDLTTIWHSEKSNAPQKGKYQRSNSDVCTAGKNKNKSQQMPFNSHVSKCATGLEKLHSVFHCKQEIAS